MHWGSNFIFYFFIEDQEFKMSILKGKSMNGVPGKKKMSYDGGKNPSL